MNWDDLRYVLAVARTETLSDAARDLRVSVSTVSRRLRALEQDVGAALFKKMARGAVLTVAGEQMIAVAESMEHLTHDLDRLALRAECAGSPTALLRLLDPAVAPSPDGGGDTAARLTCQIRLSLPDAARSLLRLQFVALVPGGEAPLGPAHPLHVAGQAAADPTQG